ncbi:MAG: PQQ-binding-like beta-propeller repeat protein [Chitinispirillales bacterium]|jgi:outer membrane protein assembly factor BamB|nr:PQQ-binding-like beta-propeller repeat protein [Chitinispirillales bacterium]
MKINKKIISQITKGLAWSSATASLIIGVLLAATIIQTEIHGPIITDGFDNIYRQIEGRPLNQDLRDEIRALDMLARKAYFTSLHQLRTGTILFFIALAVLLLSWNINAAISPPLPTRPGEKISWWKRQTQSAKTAAITSAVVAAVLISYGIVQKYELTTMITSRRAAILDSQQYAQWWMNFRGPGGNGVATFSNVPIKFNGETMENIRWKIEVPLEGFNSPVVYRDKIFLTGGNKDKRQIYSFDANTGEILWSRDVRVSGIENMTMPRVDGETGFAAPSVATDGRNVYAIFATGELAAFTINGRPRWTKFLGIPDNHYGHASSLITHNGLLFVQFDQHDVGRLLAINGRNGNIVWEAKRTLLSWGSPICVNTGERYELILVDNQYVTSYDPNTGRILWRADCLHGEVGPSAAFASGIVSVANEYAVAAGISVSDLSSIGDDHTIATTWERRGSLPNTASLVSIDSMTFMASAAGVISCLDNRDGTVFWRHQLDGSFYSSPIIVGDKIFLFDRNGIMHVFAVSAEEFTPIALSPLGEPVTTTPAILDGFMIVRGDRYLYRIEEM